MNKPKFKTGDHCIIFKTLQIKFDDGVEECYNDVINNEVVIQKEIFEEGYYDTTSRFYEVDNITTGFIEYVPEEILILKED